MLKLYIQLRDLGCAGFSKGARQSTVPCSTEDPDSLVLYVESGPTAVYSVLCPGSKNRSPAIRNEG